MSFLINTVLLSEVYIGNPDNYLNLKEILQPGDTLLLESGEYLNGLKIDNMNGTPDAWIVIKSQSYHKAVFMARDYANTIDISNSSYLCISGFSFDGRNYSNIDAIKAGGNPDYAHHIIIEDNYITGHGANQQTVGISTKTPCWDWAIRGNEIIGAGTGIYLGNSDGSDPFIRGVIENNLVLDPVGYCMQIKHQDVRPGIEGIPTEESATIIRNNVFIKVETPSPDGDRPNLLVGGQVFQGPGIDDRVEIYGNFFYNNPREYLFQGTGNISLHDNIFVSLGPGSVNCKVHNGRAPGEILIYCNTIYSAGTGVRISGADTAKDQIIKANMIFCDVPLKGGTASYNLTGSMEDAANYLNNPSPDIENMDFYPKTGFKMPNIDLSRFSGDKDYDIDFNGNKQDGSFYGAYTGMEKNPGWKPAPEKKDMSLVVNVKDDPLVSTDVLHVFPNPSGNIFNFKLDLKNAALIKFEVFHPAFRNIDIPANGNYPAGMYIFQWDASEYPSGIYYYKLLAGEKYFFGKLLLVK